MKNASQVFGAGGTAAVTRPPDTSNAPTPKLPTVRLPVVFQVPPETMAVPRPPVTLPSVAFTFSTYPVLEIDSFAANDGILRTDVLHLNGVPVVDPDTGETDIFVLELSFTSTAPDSYLAWLDTEANAWVNAVDGNFGNNPDFTDTPFAGSFATFQSLYGNDLSDYVGAWGVSQNGGVTSTWAVLNHNSDFAVVPEPRVSLLVGLGVAVVLFFRRRV